MGVHMNNHVEHTKPVSGEAKAVLQVGELERKLARLERALNEERERRLRSSGTARILALTLGYVVLEALVVYYANILGEGDNVAQRITDLWYLVSLPLAAYYLAGRFFIGKTRLLALGWPFTKLFGAEE